MQIINVGLIGYGFSGATFHAPVLSSVPGMVLYAVASSRPDDVRARWPDTRVYHQPAALLADPAVDLVVIATPNSTHYSLAHAALLAGKHVVIDKPFVRHSHEARALIALAEKQQRLLSVYHNRRWDSDFRTIQALLADDILGRIVNIESRFDRFRPQVRQRWRESDEPGSGLLYDLAPHLIDQALVLAGPPRALFAELAQQREQAQGVDFFQLVLYYDRLRVQLSAGCLVNIPTPRFVIHGTQGSYIKYGFDPQEAMLKEGQTPHSPQWGVDMNAGFVTLSQPGQLQHEIENLPGCYEAYYQGIAHAIRHQQPPPVLASAGLDTIYLIEAALQSVAERRIIALH